jgi:hypothetical protein
MKKSSGIPSVCVCRFHPPVAFSRTTRSRVSRSSFVSRQSSRTIAACMIPRSAAFLLDVRQYPGDLRSLGDVRSGDVDAGAEVVRGPLPRTRPQASECRGGHQDEIASAFSTIHRAR